ncbi:MAG: ATP-binding protein [Polyangiaceae bacterium]
MVPPERRLGPALELIDEGSYFTLTSGWQTGKTTSLFWLVDRLNAGNNLCAMSVDLQSAREEPDPAKVARTILEKLDRAAQRDLPALSRPSADQTAAFLANPSTALQNFLTALAAASVRPLVVLFDEADGLVGPAMVGFLTQLREGYIDRRRTPFPHAVALVGMRQVRDYVLAEDDRRTVAWLGTTSPFNITADALTLPTFTETDVTDLLAQHTAATGQVFEPPAAARVFELTQGHPWLVNALADQAVRREVPSRSDPVTASDIEAAKERVILDRRTHIDSLIARLREPRVRRILDPMIAGERTRGDALDDDFAYVISLGLLRRGEGTYEIANPIYREVIPRALTYVDQGQIQLRSSSFVRPDGSLDMPKLMAEWQVFWREDGHLAAEGFHYRESGPHLMLMAYLQRVVNGGGRIEREYALGRGALDLLIRWRGARHVVEVKVRRGSRTEERAVEQVSAYLTSLDQEEGWLVLFDLRKGVSWSERIWSKQVEQAGKRIHLVGC